MQSVKIIVGWKNNPNRLIPVLVEYGILQFQLLYNEIELPKNNKIHTDIISVTNLNKKWEKISYEDLIYFFWEALYAL